MLPSRLTELNWHQVCEMLDFCVSFGSVCWFVFLTLAPQVVRELGPRQQATGTTRSVKVLFRNSNYHHNNRPHYQHHNNTNTSVVVVLLKAFTIIMETMQRDTITDIKTNIKITTTLPP